MTESPARTAHGPRLTNGSALALAPDMSHDSTISTEELQAKIARGDAFHLFEVLAPGYWKKHHLPGARNLPPSQVRELIPTLVPDRAAEIVVYCWDDD